jgi:hypothetical protein
VRWFGPVIPAFRRWRQEDGEFKARCLGYTLRTYFKKEKKKTRISH